VFSPCNAFVFCSVLKVNAKVGGVNTCWSVLGHELLRKYFNKEVRESCTQVLERLSSELELQAESSRAGF
jgi:hypothetical protein